jgi:transcriptional regulator of met regulon
MSRAGGWGEKENGSGSVCPEQAELFPKKIPFDETGQRRQSRAAHFAKRADFFCTAFLSAFLCSGNPEDLIKQLRE